MLQQRIVHIVQGYIDDLLDQDPNMSYDEIHRLIAGWQEEIYSINAEFMCNVLRASMEVWVLSSLTMEDIVMFICDIAVKYIPAALENVAARFADERDQHQQDLSAELYSYNLQRG